MVCIVSFSVGDQENLKSVIMVVGKAGREGASNFTSRWGFLSLVQFSGEHHAPDPEVSSAFKLEVTFNGFRTHRPG